MWRALWMLEPTAAETVVTVPKILEHQTRSFAVQGSAMATGEVVAVDMLMHDSEDAAGQIWEPVTVQGAVMELNAAYNMHTFTGPLTIRFRKSATAAPVGISDFEPKL